MVWETAIDIATLTALPAGVRLSDLAALPADSVLLKMSNGGLYAPGECILCNCKGFCVSLQGGGETGECERDSDSVKVALLL